MIILIGKNTEVELKAIDIDGSIVYNGDAPIINKDLHLAPDWRFVSNSTGDGGGNYIAYQISNNGCGVIYSNQRKCAIIIHTNKRSKQVTKKLIISILNKYSFLPTLINDIDYAFYGKNFEQKLGYNYIDCIRYVVDKNVLTKYECEKTIGYYRFTQLLKYDNIDETIEELQNRTSPEFLESKRELKHKCKETIGKKFIVGKHYYLRSKTYNGEKPLVKEFILKKFIYTIDNKEVNSLVVKQVSGINNAIFTLSIPDCKKLHIKYEPGLQVFSMMMNWIPKNENYK